MRRILLVIVVLAGAGAYVLTSSGAKQDSDGAQYTVVFDNAFGLVKGGDVKIAGVRAGKVSALRLDKKTLKADVDFKLTKQGFGSLRQDVRCESRPQSLIGEYFIDCDPGTAPQKLKPGATIPVERTTSTIPADLLADVMRRPYRERLRIILDELGAGIGGRGDDLNAVIRRASPALRETDRVLNILAHQNQVLKDLTSNADTVIGDLADNKKDVSRFVKEAGDVATISAERRRDIEAGLQRLPTFLRELRPTMAELGQTADASTPYLRDLNASAGQLHRFLKDLGPFAEASRGNIRTLAHTADHARPAIRAAKPMVSQLRKTTKHAPELSKNLKFVLGDLDNRKRAVEKDKRSPGGQGYTGFEAILQYIFDQMMAINIYDENGHILKVNLSASKCSDYQNADSVKRQEKLDPSFLRDCLAALGPNQPGVTTRDPTDTGTDDAGPQDSLPSPPSLPGLPQLAKAAKRSGSGASKPSAKAQAAPDVQAPSTPQSSSPNVKQGSSNPSALLDYLLSP